MVEMRGRPWNTVNEALNDPTEAADDEQAVDDDLEAEEPREDGVRFDFVLLGPIEQDPGERGRQEDGERQIGQ